MGTVITRTPEGVSGGESDFADSGHLNKMGDPGLHSRYIEEQQEEKFGAAYRRPDCYVSNEERSIKLDIARIEAEMETCLLQRRAALFMALKELKWKLRQV